MKNHKAFSILFLMLIISIIAIAQTNDQVFDKESIEADLKVFKTPMAISLKRFVSKSKISNIKNPALRQVAEKLSNKEYNLDYRYATFNALLNTRTLGQQLKIGNGYSKYENMTGVYLEKGKHIVLAENIPDGKEIELLIPNWNRRAPEGINPTKDPNGWGIKKTSYPLKNGINIIDVSDWDGLAYINYFSENPSSENPINIHFVNAKVNGYFDITKNDNSDWNALIDNAVYPVIDAIGEHIQIAYPVDACKTYAYNRGVDLISNYDSLVYRQHRFIGLEKYNKVPKNKILARVNYNYYMFRDGDGVAYMGTKPGYAMAMVVNPDAVIKGDPCWGFSHEVGHVHQLRPYLNWGGLGEVSNNIVTMYVTTSFGNKSRLSAQKSYAKARESIIGKNKSYLQDPDVFNRLVPFWQLQLYAAQTEGLNDFYADLYETFRNQDTGNNKEVNRGNRNDPAMYQLNFIKQACKVSKKDLTDFFDLWGFFYVGEFELNDYGKYQYKMTEEMVKKCKDEIKAMNFAKPSLDISKLED